MAMHRSQILLQKRQYQALVRLADRKELSISEVARRLIDVGLRSVEGSAERRVAALARLDAIRREQERGEGIWPDGDPVADVRNEREEQLP